MKYKKKEYFKYQYDPVAWIQDFLSVRPWKKQIEICEALVTDDKVSVRSAHDLGKSFISACLVLWFLYTHCPSKVITTAPTDRQVRLVLWSEIGALHRRLEKKLTRTGQLLQKELRIDKDWWAVGFSTDNPDAFQGTHEEKMLVIFDEACGIDRAIFEASEGIVTTEGNKVLMIGNPTEPNNYFHWTHTGRVPGYRRIKISAFDSPNIMWDEEEQEFIDIRPLPYPKLVSMKWIKEMIWKYGEDAPNVRSRVFGEFPESAPNQLITNEMLAAALDKGVKLRNILSAMERGEEILDPEYIRNMSKKRGEVVRETINEKLRKMREEAGMEA